MQRVKALLTLISRAWSYMLKEYIYVHIYSFQTKHHFVLTFGQIKVCTRLKTYRCKYNARLASVVKVMHFKMST